MSMIKRASALSVILLLGALAASAQSAATRRFADPLLNDVVEMTRAGLSDATIVAYVKARRSRLEPDLAADDLIRLRQAGVHEPVIRYIAGAGGIEDPGSSRDRDVEYKLAEGSASPVESYDGEGYAYYYGYSAYPYWYAYSPYFTGSFFFVGGRHVGHNRGRFIHHSFGPSHFPRGHSGGRLHTVGPRGRR
jgi:hypothetical protein